MNLTFYSYRFAEEVLASPVFKDSRDEAYDILTRLPPIQRGQPPHSNRQSGTNFPVDQNAMNRWLDTEFVPKGWELHPRIVPGTRLEGDYRKDRIQIEVQFGNMARWTYDVLKFQICYSQDIIDVGMLVLPMQAFQRQIGDNVVYFERVCRELPHAKLSITLPIMLIGLSP